MTHTDCKHDHAIIITGAKLDDVNMGGGEGGGGGQLTLNFIMH